MYNEEERNSVKSNKESPWLGILIFHTFVIDLRNLTKNLLFICKEYHVQPSEIHKMQFWQYEWMTDEIKEITKEQEKQREQQEKEHASMKSSVNPGSMMRNMQSSMNVSMPKMPTISMPKF